MHNDMDDCLSTYFAHQSSFFVVASSNTISGLMALGYPQPIFSMDGVYVAISSRHHHKNYTLQPMIFLGNLNTPRREGILKPYYYQG